jgi:hypothetical protein
LGPSSNGSSSSPRDHRRRPAVEHHALGCRCRGCALVVAVDPQAPLLCAGGLELLGERVEMGRRMRRVDGERGVHQRRAGETGMTEPTIPSRSIKLARGACSAWSLTSATIPVHCAANRVTSTRMRER